MKRGAGAVGAAGHALDHGAPPTCSPAPARGPGGTGRRGSETGNSGGPSNSGRIPGPTRAPGRASLGRTPAGEGRPAVRTASCWVTAISFAKPPVTPKALDPKSWAGPEAPVQRPPGPRCPNYDRSGLQAGRAHPPPPPLLLLGPGAGPPPVPSQTFGDDPAQACPHPNQRTRP